MKYMNNLISQRCVSIVVLWVVCVIISLFDDDGVAMKRVFMAAINGTIACVGLVGVVAVVSLVCGLVMKTVGGESNRIKCEIIAAACLLVCFASLARYSRGVDTRRYQVAILGADSCSTIEVRLVSQSLVDASKSLAEIRLCPSDLRKLTYNYVVSDEGYEFAVSRLREGFPRYQIPLGEWKRLDDGKGGRRMIWLLGSGSKAIVYDY